MARGGPAVSPRRGVASILAVRGSRAGSQTVALTRGLVRRQWTRRATSVHSCEMFPTAVERRVRLVSEQIDDLHDRLLGPMNLKAGTKYERLAAIEFAALRGTQVVHDVKLVGSSRVKPKPAQYPEGCCKRRPGQVRHSSRRACVCCQHRAWMRHRLRSGSGWRPGMLGGAGPGTAASAADLAPDLLPAAGTARGGATDPQVPCGLADLHGCAGEAQRRVRSRRARKLGDSDGHGDAHAPSPGFAR
jgi:hypothetical protein